MSQEIGQLPATALDADDPACWSCGRVLPATGRGDNSCPHCAALLSEAPARSPKRFIYYERSIEPSQLEPFLRERFADGWRLADTRVDEDSLARIVVRLRKRRPPDPDQPAGWHESGQQRRASRDQKRLAKAKRKRARQARAGAKGRGRARRKAASPAKGKRSRRRSDDGEILFEVLLWILEIGLWGISRRS